MTKAVETGKLLVLAGLITLMIILLGNVASKIAVGRHVFDEDALGFLAPDVLGLHFIFTGAPFFYLALRGERRRAMWFIAAAMMLSFWTFFVWQVRQDYLANFPGGANIGLGLMMLAAPVIVCLCLP
jgi:hypothetical protein